MVRLREIPRTATFAWSPGSGLPFIATGTRAGAVDLDFSDETQLELWNLDLGNSDQGTELAPAASINTDSRFHDIAWGKATSERSRGIIAGALENGSLDLWDAESLLNGQENARMSRTSKHSGAIKSLQFNPFRAELIATAGAKGELFISDLNNVDNPFRLGSSAARADDFESLDWNKKVPHILVTGSSGGFVTVWDVKSKKESLTLNNLGRKAVSAVAWDPQNSTKLITATPDDNNPVILMWDLRNSNAPEKTLKAHEQGVLSLSWCPQDSELLLSCGKDNRTICWNTLTGEPYGEFPIVTNWTFQTRWNPHNPSLLAAASFDGKIAVQTIQNTNPAASQAAGPQRQALDGEDFFNNAQSQPQGAAFSLPKPPKWLEKPIGASFGFGGKVVSFRPTAAGARSSKVQISTYAIDSGVTAATETFEKAVKEGDFSSICEAKIADATTEEEKSDWKVIETLISANPRKELIEFLGFSEDKKNDADDASPTSSTEGDDELKKLPAGLGAAHVNGVDPKTNRLSSFFENSADGDSFLSDLSATKGAKTNNPFHIYTGAESTSDKQITKALMLGQFEKALDICLKEDRMSDAFMIAICGGQKSIEKAQAAYFTKKGKGPNYLRLLASVVGKNLWDVVYNADLTNWREVMATLCTFADANEFPDLCDSLGDRLEEQMKHDEGNSSLRRDASFCYLAGSKLEKVVKIWIEELKENEAEELKDAGAESGFSVHARSLQNLIEKVTVFREVTKFEDVGRDQTSDWKLASLYDRYTEYADIVAAHGHLEVAAKYLDLLPSQYSAAEVARNRVQQASRKAGSQAANKAPASSTRTTQRTQPITTGMASAQPAPAASAIGNPYASPASAHPSNPYAPSNTSGYAPTGYQPAGVPAPPANFGGYQQGGYQQGAGVGPPPRGNIATNSAPPPSRNTNMENWNDTPMVIKPPTSRRGTPAAQVVSSPFPNQQRLASPPPPSSAYGVTQKATPPLPPPPKAGAPPPSSSQYSGGPPPQHFAPPERPPSVAANAYAPPQPAQTSGLSSPPIIPRGPSPYNQPPSAAPHSNRYAPSPGPQAPTAPGIQERALPPPPPGANRQAPPPNPYAQNQNQFGPPSRQTAPSPYQPNASVQQQSGPPSQGPPPGSRPGTGQGEVPKAPAQPPPPARHPAGDRSHIPSNARPLFEILSGDMQRVKSRAPASYKAHVIDTEKRLNILFDHLNNGELLKADTVQSMVELAEALRARDYETAQAIHLDVLTNKTDQCGQWMVGIKRLIAMSKATP